MTDDLYDALGLDEDASAADVTRAFRDAARTAHPDIGGDPDRWALICQARDVLKDPVRRRRYDRGGTGAAEPGMAQQAAVATIGQYMMVVLADCERMGKEPSEWDLAASLRDIIRTDLDATKARKRAFSHVAPMMAKMAPRFSGDAGRIALEAAQLFANVCDEQVKTMTTALDMLKGVTFRYDAPQPVGSPVPDMLGFDRLFGDMVNRMAGRG